MTTIRSTLAQIVLIGILAALSACSHEEPASQDRKLSATGEQADRNQPENAAGLRQAPPPVTPKSTQREIDWSLLKGDSWVTGLGKFSQIEEIKDTCLGPAGWRVDPGSRCGDLIRMLETGVEESQVMQAIANVEKAAPALHQVWADTFRRAGRTFVPPAVSYYGLSGRRGVFAGPPACPLVLENAFYCPPENHIYYDAVYLAKIASAVNKVNGTDGHYALVTVAAHEMGHAASLQTGAGGGVRYREELLADCFAGVALAALSKLEAGGSQATQLLKAITPRAESEIALYLMGGPKMTDGEHEAGPIRANFFNTGFSQGLGGCRQDAFRATGQ